MQKKLFAVAICGAIVSAAPIAAACSCMEAPPPLQSLEKATAVFVGKVTQVDVVGHQKKVQLDVSRRFKGAAAPKFTVTTGMNDADCGLPFAKGEEWLVYATEYEGVMRTNLCTRTKPVSAAKADLDALGGAGTREAAPPSPTSSPTEPPSSTPTIQRPPDPPTAAPSPEMPPATPPPSRGCACGVADAGQATPWWSALGLLAFARRLRPRTPRA